MDEFELEQYLNAIDLLQFGADDTDPFDGVLTEQLWDEGHATPGCYRVLPANVDY